MSRLLRFILHPSFFMRKLCTGFDVRSSMASPKDLVTVVYRPRETMRRVLDGGRDRWTIQLVILAFICASVSGDLRELQRVLPDLSLNATPALVALALLLIAANWVIVLYVFAWAARSVGKLFDVMERSQTSALH